MYISAVSFGTNRIPWLLDFLVWATIFIVQAILVLGSIFILDKANDKKEHVNEDADSYTETQVSYSMVHDVHISIRYI